MRIATGEQLDPAPFRRWCDEWLEGREVRTLAQHLGLSKRGLYRWRYENKALDRAEVEGALLLGGHEISEAYPALANISDGLTHRYCPNCVDEVPIDDHKRCLWCDQATWNGRSGVEPGRYSKLTDEQVRALYELHKRGATVSELGRRIWRASGYRSAGSAEQGVRRGFKRLHLPTIVGTPVHRRCKGSKTWWPNRGGQCRRWAMAGSDYCMQHDPARRDEVMEHAAMMLAAQKVAA